MTERDPAQAFIELAARLPGPPAIESVPLLQAAGRVLARDLVAPRELPEQDLAAMDGYAVRAAEMGSGENRFRILGRVLAGVVFARPVRGQTCVRIMTGAPMPDGTDAVVIQEDAVDLGGGEVALRGPILPGANRRQRGEHVQAGETVLTLGRRLRPVDLALAAGLGCARLEVRRRRRVGVLSTGDELRDPPAELSPGCAYDSNRPMLLAALRAAAMDAVDLVICPDDPAQLARVVARAFALGLDALLVSGGAALGDADIVRGLGGVDFMALNVRPGRGIAFARLEHEARPLILLGLPGNAVAAYVVFHLLGLPLLLHMAGATEGPPRALHLPLAVDVQVRAGRTDYRRARMVVDALGHPAVLPLPAQGSAMIRSVGAADALVALGPAGQYRAGDWRPTYLLDTLERMS